MKGLILKDLYTVKGFGKQYLFVFGFMLMMSFLMKSTSFASMYAMLLGGMLILTSMSVDETAHFNQFALTMPVNTEMIIKAKYILLVLILAAGMVLGYLANLVGRYIPYFEAGFELVSILAIGVLFLLTYAISIPVIYKYGLEKARYVYIVVLFVLAGILLGGIKLASLVAGVEMTELPEPPIWILVIGMVAISILSLIISYKVSLKILANKEW